MDDTDKFFELGAALAASRSGLTYTELMQKRAHASVMESVEAAPFHRELCKIARVAFETAGDFHSPPALLFARLAQTEDWDAAYNRFTDPVLRALGRTKEATVLLPAVAALHDKAGGGVMKTLTAGGALGGAALGSLAFLLSRNAQQSSAENAILLEKVKAYKQLKRDIEEDMAHNDVMSLAKDNKRSTPRYDV